MKNESLTPDHAAWLLSINATTPAEARAQITYNEIHQDASRPYRNVRIELPNGDEYELTFNPSETEEEILSEPLRAWRII